MRIATWGARMKGRPVSQEPLLLINGLGSHRCDSPVFFYKSKQVENHQSTVFLHPIQSDTADMSTVSFTLSQDYGYVVQPPNLIPEPNCPIPIAVPETPESALWRRHDSV